MGKVIKCPVCGKSNCFTVTMERVVRTNPRWKKNVSPRPELGKERV